MSEKLTFHFEGALADAHMMNFYESARFQYAASRLMVKLAQFRYRGKFVQNITAGSNLDIRLISQAEGSFNINIEAPEQTSAEEPFLDISLSDLVAYVSERIVEKIDETALSEITAGRRTRTRAAVAEASSSAAALEELVEAVVAGAQIPAELPVHVQDLVKRRLSETYRERRLAKNKDAVSRIDLARGQKLISMTAPLLREMATSLRTSADTLEITTSDEEGDNTVLFLDRKMASEIEIAKVDKEITPILCDITQFNKYNGWGKLKIESGAKLVSFSIPSDILPTIKQRLIDSMKKDLVYLQTYFVRDAVGNPIRLIVVGILETPSQ